MTRQQGRTSKVGILLSGLGAVALAVSTPAQAQKLRYSFAGKAARSGHQDP